MYFFAVVRVGRLCRFDGGPGSLIYWGVGFGWPSAIKATTAQRKTRVPIIKTTGLFGNL